MSLPKKYVGGEWLYEAAFIRNNTEITISPSCRRGVSKQSIVVFQSWSQNPFALYVFSSVELFVHYLHLKNLESTWMKRKKEGICKVVMYSSGPYKNTTGLNIYNCTWSTDEHSNLNSCNFGKQLFGTKCCAFLFYLLEELLFAGRAAFCSKLTASRRARQHSFKQWKLVTFVHRTGWIIPAFATGDCSSAHKQNNRCRQLLFPY